MGNGTRVTRKRTRIETSLIEEYPNLEFEHKDNKHLHSVMTNKETNESVMITTSKTPSSRHWETTQKQEYNKGLVKLGFDRLDHDEIGYCVGTFYDDE